MHAVWGAGSLGGGDALQCPLSPFAATRLADSDVEEADIEALARQPVHRLSSSCVTMFICCCAGQSLGRGSSSLVKSQSRLRPGLFVLSRARCAELLVRSLSGVSGTIPARTNPQR